MMTRMTLALITSAAFFNVACAAEKPANVSSEAPSQIAAGSQAVTKNIKLAQATVTTDGASADTPDTDWRDLDPENTLYVDTDYGRFVIELFPEIAPKHVNQVKTLTRQKFYDFITFHRVIDGFMNQTGDPKGDGTGDSELPDIEAEFTFRRGPEMGLTVVGARAVQGGEIGVGFYKSLQMASQPSSQAILTKDGKVEAYGLHCSGVTSMARSSDPNSANSQFFLMRGTAEHLDTQYSIWGNTVWGREHLTRIKVGEKGGRDRSFVPDKMNSVRIAADVPEGERTNIQVMRTDSPSFQKFLKTQKKRSGEYPDVCDIDVPSRLKK